MINLCQRVFLLEEWNIPQGGNGFVLNLHSVAFLRAQKGQLHNGSDMKINMITDLKRGAVKW